MLCVWWGANRWMVSQRSRMENSHRLKKILGHIMRCGELHHLVVCFLIGPLVFECMAYNSVSHHMVAHTIYYAIVYPGDVFVYWATVTVNYK